MRHKIVALLSGGKDSTYTIIKCVSEGHEIVALAHLSPPPKTDELDSYMYQTVGHNVVKHVAAAIGIQLFQAEIKGTPVSQELSYKETACDEVEDLYLLLRRVRDEMGCDAVCSGAIFSTYQKNRVEEVCGRLGLVSLAPLWEQEQDGLLQEMISYQIMIRIIKVASIGLGREHVGRYAQELLPHFRTINKKFGFNICGEGGEFESLVTDCPLFGSRLVVEESTLVCHSEDDVAPVWYETFSKVRLEEKPGMKELSLKQRLDSVLQQGS